MMVYMIRFLFGFPLVVLGYALNEAARGLIQAGAWIWGVEVEDEYD